MPKVVLVTGVQAAGKTTVARSLSQRLSPPAAAFDGDVFLDMVTIGSVGMSPDPDPEAVRQLRLRYDAGALLANHYTQAGFDFVYSDIVLGPDIARWMDAIRDAQRHLVVLDPSVHTVAERERGRGRGDTYRDWQQQEATLTDAIAAMRLALDETPRRGLWLDTSGLTVPETVERILADEMRGSRY